MSAGIDFIAGRFDRIIGLPCWGVWKGIGSFLIMEFGKPRLDIREEFKARRGASEFMRELSAQRYVEVRGDWRLFVYCCHWKFTQRGRLVAHSDSPDETIAKAVRALDGQILTGIRIFPRSRRTVFRFDLGGRLELIPYDDVIEMWMLYEPRGKLLTYRSDHRYSHHPGDGSTDHERWKEV